MRRTVYAPLLAVLASWLFGCSTTITTRGLLDQMTDLSTMPEYPHPAYDCRQFSSYDRASTTPTDHERWFANRDAGFYLREEQRDGRTEYVMMDTDGPGAIVRIWSANPAGTLRIYLDHAAEPVLEVPMVKLLSGEVAGLPVPLAGVRSRGHNLHFPIPYARHCKVTSDKGGFYYHVNYRTYAEGTRVETFKLADLELLADEIATVANKLADPPALHLQPLGMPADQKVGRVPRPGRELGPGQRMQWATSRTTPGALTGLCVAVKGDDLTQLLRKLVLTMEFDGNRTVRCPLGDFFGGGPGATQYHSLPMGVNENGEFWCRWVMPFKRAARIEIRNTSDMMARVDWTVTQAAYRWTGRTMYFHAGWRVSRDVPSRPFIDWNYVQVEGQGVFAGAAFSINNPVPNWWGEGDEKIYIDDETFPSHFGTGTEDYFGYAWCSPEVFKHAYHNQVRCDGPGNRGWSAVNRWHILDRIPFETDFRFDMEIWHSNPTVIMPELSVMTYWYATPAATSNAHDFPLSELYVPAVPDPPPANVDGAQEGERLDHEASAGQIRVQPVGGASDGLHLWWTGAEPGATLKVKFGAPEAGTYDVHARFVIANDYGIIRTFVNDEPAGDEIDLFNPIVDVSDEIELGTFELTEEGNTLTIELVGANENALKRYMCGLDYVRVEPAPETEATEETEGLDNQEDAAAEGDM